MIICTTICSLLHPRYINKSNTVYTTCNIDEGHSSERQKDSDAGFECCGQYELTYLTKLAIKKRKWKGEERMEGERMEGERVEWSGSTVSF